MHLIYKRHGKRRGVRFNSIRYVQFYNNIQTIYKFLGNETFLFWVPRQNDMIRSKNKQNTKINCAIRPQLCIKCLIVNGHLYMHSKCRSIIIHQSAYQFCHIDFSPQYRFSRYVASLNQIQKYYN